ncbi:hypothetical protein, partial [Aeromicrobium sp.]|uniref:hypothetical protein n=1 Tax=Aeromicrobium sp. TaxID=1871063 RepID=UPI0019AA3783
EGEVPVDLTPVTAAEATATPPTCLADGALVLPVTEGVVYQQTPTGTGSYTITAEAAPTYKLTNPLFEQIIEVLPQVTGRECAVDGPLPVTAVPPVPPEATCTSDGTLVLPTTVGVIYDAIPMPMTNDFVVTAIAAEGYVLTNAPFLVLVNVPDKLTVGCNTPGDIKICHRTNSNVNPYVVISPDVAGVADGHDTQHEGPIWNPTLKADHIEWGDIIPPYTYLGVKYPGQNFSAEGELIYANNCVPGEGLSMEVVPAITLSDVCDGNQRPTPVEVLGVKYTFTVGNGITGPWEITATALPGFEFAEGANTVFSGDAGDSSVCLAPAVVTSETCDGAESPNPTEIMGIAYDFTVGDGESGPWEITASAKPGYFLVDGANTVFSGNAGDPASCVSPGFLEKGNEPGINPAVLSNGVASNEVAREEQMLPDTGGLPLWMLLMAGPMTAAGLLMLVRRRPVVHAFTSDGGPAYSLTLPPVKKVSPAPVETVRGFFASLVAAVRSFVGGGQR